MKEYYLDDLKNAVVLRALEDYIRGEEILNEKSNATNVTLKDYESAKHFLYSDRLQIFTKLDRDYIIDAYRKNHRSPKSHRTTLWKGTKTYKK